MKSIALILAVACTAVSFSSCCCQSQPMPPLRPFPKDCNDDQVPPTTLQEPIKVLPTKDGK